MPLGMYISHSYTVFTEYGWLIHISVGFCVARSVGIGQCEGLELRDVQQVQIPALFFVPTLTSFGI